jgi:hypothetical protein
MHWPLQLIGERGIDAALTFHSACAFKRCRHDPDMEMGFALAAVGARGATVTRMTRTFIDHIQRGGCESSDQFLPDCVCNGHFANSDAFPGLK